ncbi:MAG: aminotransferase class V-fold PLP-dependent enzyme, partial [Alphaproteobacteria bacterium]
MTDFTKTRQMFNIPEGMIYLNGNSLGPLPSAAAGRVAEVVSDEWGKLLIQGWNKAGWMAQSTALGDRIGRLIGAPEGSVIVGDTLTIKVYQALSAALELRPERRVILSDSGNFPTDLYMAQGLIGTLGDGYELKVVAPEDVDAALDETIAVMMLTEVDYATSRKHDMAALTAKAHEVGALALWDLAHSAGALPIDLTAANADFAVGCT